MRLNLSAIPPDNWRSNSGVALEDFPDWPKIRKSVLQAGDYTCRFCGFRSEKYMEVHHRDGYWWNDNESDLVVVCPLCHSCFHIGLAGMQKKGTLLICSDGTLSQTKMNRSLLEGLRKGKDMTHRLLRKIAPYIIQDSGAESLVLTANKILEHYKESGEICPAPDNFYFFPYLQAFRMTEYLVEKVCRTG